MGHMDWELHLELLKLELKKEGRGCARTTVAPLRDGKAASLAREVVKTLRSFLSTSNLRAFGPACR